MRMGRTNRQAVHLRWNRTRQRPRNAHIFFVTVLGHSSLEIIPVDRKHRRLFCIINIWVLTSLFPQTEWD